MVELSQQIISQAVIVKYLFSTAKTHLYFSITNRNLMNSWLKPLSNYYGMYLQVISVFRVRNVISLPSSRDGNLNEN